MKRTTILLTVILVVGALMTTYGCWEAQQSADFKQTKATEIALDEAQRQIGMPNIVNYQQRKQMKWIYELADREDLVTYVYIKADMTGKLIFVGKALGYGVPFSAQFTNPEKVVQGDHELGYDISGYVNYPMLKPQADPNGLFMPTSSSATWVIMIDPETGDPRPQYWEPEIVVSPFALSKHLGPDVVVGNEDNWGKKTQ